jgi:parallel beta-helix repeat protein
MRRLRRLRRAALLVPIALVVAAVWIVATRTPGRSSSTAPSPPAASTSPTAPSPSPSLSGPVVTVLAAGDIASCAGSGEEKTAALVAANSGTVITLGDNAYESGSAAEFANCYNPSWGEFLGRTDPAPGNHDYRTPHAAAYFHYFGAAAGDSQRGYYAFELGAWRLYSLNSNCDAIGGCELGSPEANWLRDDLAAHPTTCILAYWHHARFSSGSLHGNDPRTDGLWRTLQDAGADLILTGHDHDYERFMPQNAEGQADPNGIREFVVGTGGSGLRAIGTVLPTSEAANGTTHGILRLELGPDGYTWQFIPVAGGTFTDSGSGTCTPIPTIAQPAGSGTAGTFIVSPTGNDTADGTAASPWLTVQHAVDVAPSGSTILVQAGTYAGFDVRRPGLTVMGGPGDPPAFTSPVRVLGTHDVALRSFDASGATGPYEAAVSIERSSVVTVADSTIHGNSVGIELASSNGVTVEANEVYDNASAIEVHTMGDGTVISHNRIHDNGRVLDSSRGGTGINVYLSSGTLTIQDNDLVENHTPNYADGVGIEVYGSSNVVIENNRFRGHLDVIETGTDGTHGCNNLRIVGNLAYRSASGEQHGMILRCASNTLVANNTLVGFDLFAFDVSHNHGKYGGSINGLRIVNNIAAGGRAFSIDSRLPASVVIDHDLVWPGTASVMSGRYLAFVAGRGNTTSLAEFRSWTHFERHGIQANPGFVDPSTDDYVLRDSSPAVDVGIPVAGRPFDGSAPDLGYYELDR